MNPSPHILYSFRRCPYAMRARLALASSGVSVSLREVVLRDKPPEMLVASPKGTVPVLVPDEGEVVEESLDVMHWALAQNDPEGWLQTDAEERNALIATNDGPFKHHLDRYKYANRHEGAVAGTHRDAAAMHLHELDARLAKSPLTEPPWLCGTRATIADYALLPFVRQFANTDRAWFDAQAWPYLTVWLETFLASPRFQAVMKKYPRWQAGDAELLFPDA